MYLMLNHQCLLCVPHALAIVEVQAQNIHDFTLQNKFCVLWRFPEGGTLV